MTTADHIILQIMDLLIFQNKVRNKTDFCEKIGLTNTHLARIKDGRQHFSPAQIENLCTKFNINANVIFSLETNIFRDRKKPVISDLISRNLAS